MAVSEKAASLVQRWLELDQDAASRAEVQAWLDAGDEATISRLLGRRLEFGTAGLRGRMGPGFNQMNSITVQQTTQGLVRYLQREIPERLQSGGVVIGAAALSGPPRVWPTTATAAMDPSAQSAARPHTVLSSSPPAQALTGGTTAQSLPAWPPPCL